METSSQQLLLNDSFSYGWLLNVKSSAVAAAIGDSHRSLDTGSFIEIDPNLVVSLRWTTTTATDLHGLDLDLPRRQTLADEIFSGGHRLPGQEAAAASNSALLRKSQSVNSNRYQGGVGGASTTSSPLFHSAKSSPGSPAPSRMGGSSKLDSRFASSCAAKSPKKIICRYLCFLMPLYRIVKDLRLVSSTSSSSSSKSSASGGRDSARSSPRSSDALSSIDWCRNNADISISDAILHCKKSIGQAM